MLRQNEEKRAANWIKEASKGYIRVAILILLSRQSAHGYEIMKEIKDRTKGLWMPTPGGVYPILRDLEKAGCIKGRWSVQRNRRIKVYEITGEGRLVFRRAIEKQNELAKGMNTLFRDFAREVLNMEPTALPVPVMPTPFAPFLEDKRQGRLTPAADLMKKRRYLERTIASLEEELRSTEKALARPGSRSARSAKRE